MTYPLVFSFCKKNVSDLSLYLLFLLAVLLHETFFGYFTHMPQTHKKVSALGICFCNVNRLSVNTGVIRGSVDLRDPELNFHCSLSLSVSYLTDGIGCRGHMPWCPRQPGGASVN